MKKFLFIYVAVFVLAIFQMSVQAISEAEITSAMVNNTQISAYINTETTNCTAMLGTTSCEIISYSQAENLPSDTLILVDTSGSIPKDVQFQKLSKSLNTAKNIPMFIRR